MKDEMKAEQMKEMKGTHDKEKARHEPTKKKTGGQRAGKQGKKEE
jgi:hypothetical protein